MPENPYTDHDRMLTFIRAYVEEIYLEIDRLGDFMNDKQRERMGRNVLSLLDELSLSVPEVFPQEVVDAYREGFNIAGADLENILASELRGDLSNKVHAQAVQELVISGVDDLQASIRTAQELFIFNIQSTLREIQDNIAKGVLSGLTVKQITKRVKSDFLQAGLTAFTTIDGRKLPLDFYAMTVTRQKTRDAHVKGSVNRYLDNKVTVVKINERHPTCHICGARQGMVISLTGEHEGVPTVDDIGGLPPFHPNCRHYVSPVTDLSREIIRPFNDNDQRTDLQKKMYKQEQDIRRKANAEKKQYLKMKAEAEAGGQNFPPIGTWRRMKRKNDEGWKKLQQDYRESAQEYRNAVST